MQADNLRQEDVDRLAEAFKEIEEENPSATLQVFLKENINKKDCLFKEKCNKTKRRNK